MSVRLRVTLVAVAAVALVLAAASMVLVGVQQQVLRSGLDDALRQRADDLEAILSASSLPDRLASRGGDDALAQVVSEAGEVLLASPLAASVPPLGPPVAEQRLVTTSLPLDDDDTFRMLSRPVVIAGQDAVLHVVASAETLEESRAALIAALAVGTPVVVLVLAGLVWAMVGRALAPVARIQEEVAAISSADGSRRIPETGTDDEIGRLARLMNEMLARLDDAAARQRRFVSDAAHELRSPIARIRSELEVDAAHPDAADAARTAAIVLDEAVQMQALVDDLLFLARHDEQRVAVRRTTIDLAPVVAAGARRAPGDDVEVLVELEPCTVSADAEQIRRAVRNLVDNAVRHASARVEVQLRRLPDLETPAGAEIVVTDDGPGVPAEHAEVLFERFARLDDARSREAGGAGLGLAIVRQVAHAHGGTVELDVAHEGGARFVLRLPAVPLS